MDRENKAELGANLIKLGLAIVSVMCPQAGIASATIDLALSVINSSELLKEPFGNDVNLQLRKCITDVINRIRSRNHTATHKQLIEMYIIPRYELWLSTGDARVLQDGDIDRLFCEWIDNKEAQREMYLTETDIQKINELFIELLKEELFKYPNLASWYGYHQINTLDQRFRTQYIDLVKRMNELESQLQEFIKTKNPKVEVILGKELSEQLWYASKTEYGIAKQKGNRFAYDIIERLLPNGYIPKLAVPIEGKMEEGENYPLMELYNATNEHVAIIGNGGSGKTTFLQHLMSKAFSDEMTYSPGAQIPVFIELNRCPADIGLWYDELLGKTNFITRYIGTLLENHAMLDAVDSRMLAYIEKEFQKRPENGKPQYVLLLDDF